ncbi:L10-interacting MYB domain-containing protein-like [Gossypium raimondii]|uniref:L10-interacting MYB domain-containing protein-like n=1 Tax=Gossypium raimondii TaxID=29730 RepID=UPI00227D3B8B|nr:L10-interacting MYB domain-containing protein-like [Gossypium raimondii]
MVKTRNFVEGDSTLATKVVWDDELTLIFCKLCVNEVNAGNRPTTHLNSKGLENVVALFQAKTQKIYGKLQLKTKWDTLKKEWRLWRELLKESTGIGWCPSKKTVDATEEWWAAKIQENPDFKGFKKKGIEPRLNELMWQMFGGIVATGENAWAPSSGVLPSGIPMGDDAPNEEFGDSDKHSNENEGIPPDEVPSKPSHEIPNRRKQTLGAVHGKGKKSSSSRKSSRITLTTQIEKLCESMASPRKSVTEIIFPHSQYTISNAMDALRALGDEIPKKDELYYFATKMFQIPVKREVFLNLDPDDRVWWLRCEYAEQNPIASFSSLNGKVSAMEKLALSLYILGNRESNSNAKERFQRSGETVSRIFTDILHIFGRMRINTIKPTEGQFEEVPNHIRHDTRYWPHFKLGRNST